jgi:hypothetical protein
MVWPCRFVFADRISSQLFQDTFTHHSVGRCDEFIASMAYACSPAKPFTQFLQRILARLDSQHHRLLRRLNTFDPVCNAISSFKFCHLQQLNSFGL